ncbi:alpha/beta hydrolase fold domain-containing protein [Subtercola lobariae]|uniref:Esterase n=1 Tax=Subtercola lobariae TaxID=1588641 RepID=A0A917F2X1_9MICO|nr:alpha/beta hydrolase fold domain-containing protein [Subtercola lobariae]GGF37807.1 esterase [Subtercola lobariae]
MSSPIAAAAAAAAAVVVTDRLVTFGHEGEPAISVPVRVYSTGGAASADIFVWMHGGGFTGGDLDMPESDWVCRELAARTGRTVIAVDYRLATPDGPHYPIPSDDVVAVWRAASANPRSFTAHSAVGESGSRISMGGASAGANLAAGAVFRLRDAGHPLPDSVVLVYPTLHADQGPHSAATMQSLSVVQPGEPRFEPLAIAAMYATYLGAEPPFGPSPAVPGLLAPADFPPTFIVTSDIDDLRTSGELFGAALALEGREVHIVREYGTRHGHLNSPEHPGAASSIARIAAWLDAH